MARPLPVSLLLLLIGLSVLSACGCSSAQPKLNVTSADKVGEEIERIAYEIGPPESIEFRYSAKGLVAHAISQVPIEQADQAAIKILHGKTPRVIVAEWEALSSTDQAAAKKLAFPNSRSALPELSPSDDRLMKATIKLATDSRGKDQQVAVAIQNAQRVQRERDLSDTWLAEQYEKGANHMVKEFGANSPNAEK
jgi:hypothetical protein